MADIRRAARVLLIDRDGRVLLLFGADPSLTDDAGWWFTPGGGVEGSESLIETAIREVFEETGLRLEAVTGPIGHRDTTFTFEGVEIHQVETYYTASVDAFEIDRSGWSELEQRSVHGSRWWSVAELEATRDTVYPEILLELLGSVSRRS
ncbi:MAG TPA: NUDIX domain-containing protein [Galbitalea sp.]